MKKIFLLIFPLLLGLISYSQTDVKVESIYTLGQIPAPLGVYRHSVSAKIINLGITTLTNLPIVLNVTGANSFLDTQRITINSGDTSIVNFNSFSPWNLGTDQLIVNLPTDDNNSNNSATYSQIVNNKIFSYADNGPLAGAVGFGTGTGILSNRYNTSGSGIVTEVIVHISDLPSNVGNTVYGVVIDGASIVAQSAAHIITLADLNTDVSFEIIDPPSVLYNFYVGLLQTSNSNAYFPVAYQNEGVKTRPSTYYGSFSDGTGLAATTTSGRFMIKAVLEIGDVTPFNFSISQPVDYVLAGWDFSGIDALPAFPATTFDTVLASSKLITRGPGASASQGAHSFKSTGFQNDGISISNTDYFQITLSPKPGDLLSLSAIGGNLHSNDNVILNAGAGVRSQFAYSLDGTNFTLIGNSFLSSNLIQEFTVSLSSISALQNITSGTTVTIRYFASGIAALGDWGFFSTRPGYNGLAVYGKLVSSPTNSILTSPVIPTGADYTLSNCSSTASGSISFTSIGTFLPDNKYIVQLGKIYQPHANIYRFKYPVNVGEITSNSNSGTINFTIPANTSFYDYALRIISTGPYTAGSFSQEFVIAAKNCSSQPDDYFRSTTSGNWNDLNTWESLHGNNDWVPASIIPNEIASKIEILRGHTVFITNNVSTANIIVKGKLILFNRADSLGTITFAKQTVSVSNPMFIDTSGEFMIVSQSSVYNDVILFFDGKINIAGKITIGDGGTIANGFHSFATRANNSNWRDGSVFEWNSNAGEGLRSDLDYFPDNFSVATLRLTNIPGGNFGGSYDLTINGLLDVNSPVTFTGSGTKTIRDGMKGNSILMQSPTCGKLFTTSIYQFIPASTSSVATMQGILAGTLNLQLNELGLQLSGGVTIPDTSKVIIAGKCNSLQNINITSLAQLTLSEDTLFIENANLENYGKLLGPGTAQFTGNQSSILLSPGKLTATVSLLNKELHIGSNTITTDISMIERSNLWLDQFNLDIGTSGLLADSVNFIVTNDTGRLSRFVNSTPLLFPIGINSSSYNPITITNTGIADNIKARVGTAVQTTVPITDGNVDRTWFIGDTTQTGPDLTLLMQWNTSDEQPDFDRANCYVSHYQSCQINCNGAFFDVWPTGPSTGSTSYTIQRSGITNFSSPAFIITSNPFKYTFTGNGDWNNAANWSPALVAPTAIPAGIEVYIDPIASGQCIYNGNIKVQTGGKLTVRPDKRLTITGNLIIE